MTFRPTHLIAAAAVTGAVIVGGASWASAQDSSSSTSDDPAATAEEPVTPSEDGTAREDCPERGAAEAPSGYAGGYS